MPSPRSVLIDLETHGLDPSVAHSSVNKNGNLVPAKSVPAEPVAEPVVEKKQKAVKSGLVKLEEEQADDGLAVVIDDDDDAAKKAAKKHPKKVS